MSGFEQPVQVEWRDSPPKIDDQSLVVITEALLPMFVWPQVPVVRAVEQKLSNVERFLIEAALALGDLTAGDVEELTGLPAEATDRIAGRLCQMGVLNAVSHGYLPCQEVAREALEREVLVEYRKDYLTFVVLPRTDDVLAFERTQGRPEPPKIDRLDPVHNAPVPESYRLSSRTEVLRTQVKAGQVRGLPHGVVEVAASPDDRPVGDMCPVYRCAGQLGRQAGQLSAVVHVYGGRTDHRERLDLSEAGGIVAHWFEQADLLSQPAIVQAACAELDVDPADAEVHQIGPAHWVFQLNATGALATVAGGRSLIRPGALEMIGPEGTTKTEVAVRFEPMDGTASVIFTVDLAAERLDQITDSPLRASDMAEAIASASKSYNVAEDAVTERAVRERLWRSGRQHLVYLLRAAEDFDYA